MHDVADLDRTGVTEQRTEQQQAAPQQPAGRPVADPGGAPVARCQHDQETELEVDQPREPDAALLAEQVAGQGDRPGGQGGLEQVTARAENLFENGSEDEEPIGVADEMPQAGVQEVVEPQSPQLPLPEVRSVAPTVRREHGGRLGFGLEDQGQTEQGGEEEQQQGGRRFHTEHLAQHTGPAAGARLLRSHLPSREKTVKRIRHLSHYRKVANEFKKI